jgi:hypothetical protein
VSDCVIVISALIVMFFCLSLSLCFVFVFIFMICVCIFVVVGLPSFLVIFFSSYCSHLSIPSLLSSFSLLFIYFLLSLSLSLSLRYCSSSSGRADSVVLGVRTLAELTQLLVNKATNDLSSFSVSSFSLCFFFSLNCLSLFLRTNRSLSVFLLIVYL